MKIYPQCPGPANREGHHQGDPDCVCYELEILYLSTKDVITALDRIRRIHPGMEEETENAHKAASKLIAEFEDE